MQKKKETRLWQLWNLAAASPSFPVSAFSSSDRSGRAAGLGGWRLLALPQPVLTLSGGAVLSAPLWLVLALLFHDHFRNSSLSIFLRFECLEFPWRNLMYRQFVYKALLNFQPQLPLGQNGGLNHEQGIWSQMQVNNNNLTTTEGSILFLIINNNS